MRYKSFTIKNFKGIKETTVHLDGIAGAAVIAFVGLNESGKTTLLEAIHSFSPDEETSELVGEDDRAASAKYNERVPRHLISRFTGEISVLATLSVSPADKVGIARFLAEQDGIEVNIEEFPDQICMERHQRFENGDFKKNYFSLRTDLKVKKAKQLKWRSPGFDEKVKIRNAVYSRTPDIAYFPTFVFDFPKAIFLSDRGEAKNQFYRRVFQDVLDFDGQGQTIERDIVGRVRGDGLIGPWTSFLSLWGQHDDRAKIQHVMDRASAAVTRLVFGRWNKILGEDTRGKEVVISFEPLEGETEDESGNKTKTEQHDVSIEFQIKDGTRRFNVNDRSLGFRWFFAFMLFTQFRAARSSSRPVLFLFDEPASNLHAAAQQKLIDSFPEIARNDHMLAYTTHSHYMVEPKWLEQTYIVTNRADAPVDSVLDDISLDDESLDIKASSYRSFVNQHPNQTSYFQPILDRLQVAPSRFDLNKSSVILEGRSDYYILRYAAKATKRDDIPMIPVLGASTFGALAALHVGWNLSFFFLLDSDKQGNDEKERYISDFGIRVDRIATIEELVPEVKVIEDLLDENALAIVQKELQLTEKPTKGQIKRFFQERLASDNITDLGNAFNSRAATLLDKLKGHLA